MNAVADDVADHQAYAAPRQPDHVEPVTAHGDSSGGGLVASGHLDSRLLGQAPRKQAALQGERGGVLAGVAPGVVNADGCTGHHFLGEDEVVVPVALGPPAAGEDRDSECGPACLHRDHHDGVEPVPDGLGGPRRVVRDPRGDGAFRAAGRHRAAGRQAVGGGRALGVGVHLSRTDQGLGTVAQDRAAGYPAERDGAGHGTGRRLVAAQHGIQKIDHSEVREPGDGHLDQFLAGPGHVEGAADPGTRLVHQRQPLVGQVLPGHVKLHDQHPAHPARRVYHRGEGYVPGTPDRLTRPVAGALPHRRLTGSRHLPCPRHDRFGPRGGDEICQALPKASGLRLQPEYAAHCRIKA